MGRRGYRRRYYTDWTEYHAAERAKVSSHYGGVDADVRQVFFNLPPEKLNSVFADYRAAHGPGPLAYARAAYRKWKSGTVQMSGQVSERLLAIVPRHLDFATKYDLLEKLCRRREGTRLRVEISADMPAGDALEVALRSIENARSTRLPEYITQRLHWLADNDGEAAQTLLSRVLAEEHKEIVRAVKQELQHLLERSSMLVGTRVELNALREIVLPGATVQIVLNGPSVSKSGRSHLMSNESHNQRNQGPTASDGGLAPAPNAGHGGHVISVPNAQEALEQPFQFLPPEKLAELLGKAAEVQIQIQEQKSTGEVDLDMISGKIDTAARVADEAARNPHVDVTYTTVHRSKHGDTHIKVVSRPAPQPASSGCMTALIVGLAFLAVTAWLV